MKKSKDKMTPTEKAKVVGTISDIILKSTQDRNEIIQILDAVVSFTTDLTYCVELRIKV